MTHRVFIAINLPEETKKVLLNFQNKISAAFPDQCPIKWTKIDNLHITLVFLGAVSNDELLEVCRTVAEISQKHSSFSLKLNKIVYGPPKAVPPRMVWVNGEKSEELARIKDDLERLFSGTGSNGYEPDKRTFSPHITLGRIKAWQFQRIEPEERPEINEEISLEFPVTSLEVMESELKRGGPEYAILESCQFLEADQS